MKVARWFYVQDSVFPPSNGAGKPFHHPGMCAEIMRVVKENPESTGSEIAAHPADEEFSSMNGVGGRVRCRGSLCRGRRRDGRRASIG